MGIPTIMLIDPALQTISQYRDGDLVPLAGGVQQLSGSRCSIDWAKVEDLLD
jgi:hypothetical protein